MLWPEAKTALPSTTRHMMHQQLSKKKRSLGLNKIRFRLRHQCITINRYKTKNTKQIHKTDTKQIQKTDDGVYFTLETNFVQGVNQRNV